MTVIPTGGGDPPRATHQPVVPGIPIKGQTTHSYLTFFGAPFKMGPK